MSHDVPRAGLVARERRVASLLGPLVVREIRARYQTSALDAAWAILNPAITMAVYGVILTQAFRVEAACGPYVVSAWSGLVLWTFFATGITSAVTSIISSSSLVTKVYFPREALPLAATGSALFDLAIGLVTVVAMLVVSRVGLSLATLWAVLPIVMLVIWTAAVGIAVATVAVFARDVAHLVYLVARVGVFATPVFYEADVLPDTLASLTFLNPVAVAVDGMRTASMCGQVPDLGLVAAHTVAGVVALGGAVLYARSVEGRMADLV